MTIHHLAKQFDRDIIRGRPFRASLEADATRWIREQRSPTEAASAAVVALLAVGRISLADAIWRRETA